jgi:hypothetical protein
MPLVVAGGLPTSRPRQRSRRGPPAAAFGAASQPPLALLWGLAAQRAGAERCSNEGDRSVGVVLIISPCSARGAGQSRRARRLTSMLPAMTLAEALEPTRVRRGAGLTDDRTTFMPVYPAFVYIDAWCSGSHTSSSRARVRASMRPHRHRLRRHPCADRRTCAPPCRPIPRPCSAMVRG